MKIGRLCALVAAAAMAVTVVTLGPAASQPKIPPDFSFDQGKDSPAPVTFSHAKHQTAGVDKCTACHTKVFKMKKGQTGPLRMAKMKAGEQCGACHDGKTQVATKTVFNVDDKAKCDTCHKKG